MSDLAGRFLRDEHGATAIEYALIAVLISLVVFAGVAAVTSTISGKFQLVTTKLGS